MALQKDGVFDITFELVAQSNFARIAQEQWGRA